MQDDNQQLTAAREVKARGPSLVWIVPIVALIVTVSLLLHNVVNSGATIYLTAATADGIEAGKTLVKMRSVTIGLVTEVNLDDDFQQVVLTVEMDKGTDDLLHDDTVFWIVKPRVEGVGITGLETILTGAYIQCYPGSDGEKKHTYSLLDELPLITDNQSGVKFVLEYDGSKKIKAGDRIEYRGIQAGSVLSSAFDPASGRVNFNVFVQDQYARLFNASTRFWINSGIDMSLTSSGFNLNTDSLMSIIQGGLTFDNLSSERDLQPMQINKARIFESKNDAYTDYLSNAPSYIVFLNCIYKNLQVGSDVIYHGVRVGRVTKNPFITELRYLFGNNEIPVLFSLDLKHDDLIFVQDMINAALAEQKACIHMDSSGFLSMGNQLQLTLDGQCPGTEQRREFHGYKVIPLNPAGLEGDIGSILSKINDIDTRGISAELKQALQAFTDVMNSIHQTTRSANNEKLVENLSRTITSFNKTLEAYGSDTEVYSKLNDVLGQVNKILQDVGPAINEFGQKPNALIFSDNERDIIPRRAAR